MVEKLEIDIAVVGAGGCGLVAALTAAEANVKVLLLEKGATPGGSTGMSAGLFVAAGSRLQHINGEMGTPEELAADIYEKNDYCSGEAVTLALCQASGPLMDWLVDRGAGLEHMAGYRYPGMSRSWIHAPLERHGQ
ncbi:MAG: FAD-dependent oxidoreductase, partial [Anaerolineae bacterium]|nr:FAD-dependent oxidoreductase [Anaerolineae bacterium]